MKNSIDKIGKLLMALALFQACASEPKEATVETQSKVEKSLNVSVLLDLSDRIDTVKYNNQTMHYYKRDIGYIQSITDAFTAHLQTKRVFFIKDKIQVFIDPEPKSAEVNSIVENLRYSFTKKTQDLNNKVGSLSGIYQDNVSKLYEQTHRDNSYVGSDIWNFFKLNVKDYCIDKDYSNVLIILTDGYIYHQDSKYDVGNKSSYLTSSKIRQNGLNKSDYKELMQQKDFGFITESKGLENLKVLVIGVNPSKKSGNSYEGDVIRTYWEKWFEEMGVTKYKIVQADLPANTDKLIRDFISED